MFNRDNWKEIFETIQKNKLRTFLSGFTVALGILIFVVLYGFGNGLKNTFNEFFGNDATNVLYLFPGRTTEPYLGYKANRRIEFDNSDLKDIKENFAMFLDYVTPQISRGALAKYGQESDNYSIRAAAPSIQEAEKVILMEGRFINQSDIDNKTKNIVIGRLVKKDLFKGKPALGEFIDLGGSSFRVVGVFQDDGGDREERIIYMSYTSRQRQDKATDKVDQIIVGFKPEIGYTGAMALEKSLNTYFREKKYISPKDPNGMYIRNVTDQLKQNQQFAGVLQIIISFFCVGTLIAGIIGISNIMVFVVKERTKEIGIRKALGATPRSVIGTILLESIFITTISGFIGMMIGVGILTGLGDTLKDYFITDPYIDVGIAIASTIMLIIFGGIAGYIPAKRAADIKPIVALRDE